MTATVPTNSTGRHIALWIKSNGWYIDFSVHSVSCSNCAIEDPTVLHRRGTTMEIAWAQVYDTVLVQYGPRDFALGSGTIDTFLNASQGTLHGLTPNMEYDLFVYGPCQTPCEDMRYTRRTAMRDYPLPWCEDFTTLSDNDWYEGQGDWRKPREINGRPNFSGQPFYSATGQSLVMSSWGFAWDYYGMAMLPDVEVDSHTVLSFYMYD